MEWLIVGLRGNSIILFIVFVLVVFPESVKSASNHSIAPLSTKKIEEFGVCKRVTNNHAAHNLWVPTSTNTEWSSFYSKPGSASVSDCLSCSLPWGGSIAHGASVTAYSTSLPTGPCSSFAETRSCDDGSLSGSYTHGSCTNGCANTPCGPLASGGTCVAYSTNAPVGAACSTVQQTRTCTNGTLSGSYTHATCNSGCPATTVNNCQLTARAHGESSGSCASGYNGSCSYLCNNGSNVMVSNTCAVAGGTWTPEGVCTPLQCMGFPLCPETSSCETQEIGGTSCPTIGARCLTPNPVGGAPPHLCGGPSRPILEVYVCK